jgi:two-component system LytT family response regulator
MSGILRAVVVEDEPLARRTLRDLVALTDGIELVGEAADGLSAVALVDELRPDLLFLDVQLPELSGLQVLERLTHRPAVIFTTAHDRYAVAAFELEAVDYLMKPFGLRRFQAAVERLRRRLDASATRADDADRARMALQRGPLRRVFARQGERIVPVAVEDITHIEAKDDYAEVHAGGETHLLSLRLSDLEARLDPERFLRIHRSHVVSLDAVAQVRARDDRRLEVVLRDGTRLVASRAGSQRLREMMR